MVRFYKPKLHKIVKDPYAEKQVTCIFQNELKFSFLKIFRQEECDPEQSKVLNARDYKKSDILKESVCSTLRL